MCVDFFDVTLVNNNDEDAKLRPRTSLEVVKLAPICSTSLLVPPSIINRLFLFKSHLPEIPYLNLLSLNP
jgi:hypothetical protein